MAKGIFGKIIEAATSDDGERRARKAKGEKHGGILGAIEDRVTPDTSQEKAAKAARKRGNAAQRRSPGGLPGSPTAAKAGGSGGLLGRLRARAQGGQPTAKRGGKRP